MKKRIENVSIKYKIWIYLIGFCILLLSILWIAQVGLLKSFYKSVKMRQTRQAVKAVERSIDSEYAQDLIESIAQENEVCVLVLSNTATEIFSAEELRDCSIHKMPFLDKKMIVEKTLTANREIYQNYERQFDKKPMDNMMPPQDHKGGDMVQSLVYSKPIKNAAGKELVVVVNTRVEPVDATVYTLRIQLTFVTFVTLIVAGIMSFYISRKVAEPIEKINESAKILAQGNYDVVFKARGYKEINELSDTLTYTATELSKVESLRQEFIANISHDLRTPLTLIGGYAEVMRDIPGENSPENAQVVIDEAKRLATLVSDVLSISKIQAGVTLPVCTPYNITSSIQKTVERMQELLKSEGYSINFEYNQDVIVKADELLISQSFYNLLTNAVTYTGTDKLITVRQVLENSSVRIEVCDTGDGIAAANLPYVWERYYRIDKTHKRAVTGTGIGLSIVKSLVTAHGGKYGVISEEGKGSTFWFSLGL